MTAAAAVGLAMLLCCCAQESDASYVVVGWAGPTHGVVLPAADSLLPPAMRHDSAAIVARVVETKMGSPIGAQVAVVPEGAPVPNIYSKSWTWVDSGQFYVKRLAPGNYQIVLRDLGYHDAIADVRLRAGAIDTLYARMHTQRLVVHLRMSVPPKDSN